MSVTNEVSEEGKDVSEVNGICDQETFEKLMKHNIYDNNLKEFSTSVVVSEKYHTFSKLNNLHGYILVLRDLYDIKIKDCDLEENDAIYIEEGTTDVTIQNSTINNFSILDASDLRCITFEDSYIESLKLNYTKDIGQIFLCNTIIDKIKFNNCMINCGLLINKKSIINNLIAHNTFINNTSKYVYNAMFPNGDIVLKDRLIDIVKNEVDLKHSYIIEEPNDELCTFTINNNKRV